MSEKFVRVYKNLDIYAVSRHLLIYGDLAAQCANCQAMDLKLDQASCPNCAAEFKYIAFRNVANHLPKMRKLHEQRPHITLIDYDDYRRCISEFKAKEFLK